MVGVAYKPDVADMRESSALEIIDGLTEAGAVVSFTDPLVEQLSTPVAGQLFRHCAAEREQWDLVVLIHSGEGENYPGISVLDTSYRS